jgi:MFS family permease
MPWTMAPMIIAPLAGLFSGRIGTRALIVTGLALEAIALFWLASIMSATVPYRELVGPFLVAGVGMGLVFAPSSTAVLATMKPQDHAKASGTNSTLREVGVALGIAVLTAVFTGAGGQLTPTGYVAAAIPAVIVGASVLTGSALLALFLPAGRSPRADARTDARALARTDAPAVASAVARANGGENAGAHKISS